MPAAYTYPRSHDGLASSLVWSAPITRGVTRPCRCTMTRAPKLTRLSTRKIVLIEALDRDFVRRLDVLTRDTGAGKSILLDALGFILGDRAETSPVPA